MSTTTKKKLTMPLARFRAWIEQVMPFADDGYTPALAAVHLRAGRAGGKRWVVAEATDRYAYAAHRLEVGGDGDQAALLSAGEFEALIPLRSLRLLLSHARPAPMRDGGRRARLELTFVTRPGADNTLEHELQAKATGPLHGGLERLELTVPLEGVEYPDMAALVGRTWARAAMAPVIVTGTTSALERFARVRPLNDDQPTRLTMWGGTEVDGTRTDRHVMVTVGDDFVGMFTQTTAHGTPHAVPVLDAWDGLLTRPKP